MCELEGFALRINATSLSSSRQVLPLMPTRGCAHREIVARVRGCWYTMTGRRPRERNAQILVTCSSVTSRGTTKSEGYVGDTA